MLIHGMYQKPCTFFGMPFFPIFSHIFCCCCVSFFLHFLVRVSDAESHCHFLICQRRVYHNKICMWSNGMSFEYLNGMPLLPCLYSISFVKPSGKIVYFFSFYTYSAWLFELIIFVRDHFWHFSRSICRRTH